MRRETKRARKQYTWTLKCVHTYMNFELATVNSTPGPLTLFSMCFLCKCRSETVLRWWLFVFRRRLLILDTRKVHFHFLNVFRGELKRAHKKGLTIEIIVQKLMQYITKCQFWLIKYAPPRNRNQKCKQR